MPDPEPDYSESLRAHRRQFIWQILLPILLVAALGLAAGGLTIASSLSGDSLTRPWADIALIWLIAPLMALGLVMLIVLGVLIWGFIRLTRITPRYTRIAQSYVAAAGHLTQQAADGAVKPIVWIRQAGAAVQDALRKLAGLEPKPKGETKRD